MSNVLDNLPPWLDRAHRTLILPRRAAIAAHPFMQQMLSGSAEPQHAEAFFSGLMWHLLDFGAHVRHLFAKRPADAARILENRSEDKDGDTGILGRIVEAFGGDTALIAKTPWRYRPHRVWIQHDALLRAAIYSSDLPWQVGTAALNVGIEALVPFMIEPLFKASVERYGVSRSQAAWLESRAGEEERQHGENGYILLSRFVDAKDTALQDQCAFFIEALSASMAYGLLQSGLRPDSG